MQYTINLLPDELRMEKRVDTKVWLTKIGLYTLVTLFVIAEIIFLTSLFKLKFNISNMEEQISQLAGNVALVQNIKQKNNEMRQRINSFESMNTKSNWVDLLENISAIMPDKIWLSRIALTENNSINIEGNVDKLSTLGNYMVGLRSIEGLKNVNLISSVKNLNGIKFTIIAERGE